MQKPNYISIDIPAGLKDFSPAAKKVLSGFFEKIVNVDFSSERHRKTFQYKIYYSKAETLYGAMGGKKTHKIIIKLVKI